MITLRAQYVVYFGTLGIFLPYFNLYCHHLGFDGFQIGALSAGRSIMLTVFPVLWGLAADRYHARKLIFSICCLTAAVVWAGLLVVTGYREVFFLTLLHALFFAPIISFLEAFTMDALRKKRAAYGTIRVWGSAAYVVIVLLLGRAMDVWITIESVVGLILAGSILQVIVSFRLPDAVVITNWNSWKSLRLFLSRPMTGFLISAFFMLAGHGAYYAFFSIHLKTLGFSTGFIGLAWALASIAEIGVMVFSRRLFQRFSLARVMILSFVVAAFRWAGLSVVTHPAGILLLQLTHCITYAGFHMASILFMDQHSPPDAKTFGQALNNAATYGLGLIVGFFISGWLYENWGAFAMFSAAVGMAVIGGLVFIINCMGKTVHPA